MAQRTRRTGGAAAVTRPERLVVEQPPPDPDYPRYRLEPGSRLRLAEVDPEESEHYRRKKDVAKELQRQRQRIADLQARLYGEKARSLLIVLQAMDTGGKDGTIKGVFQGVNPQGCQVWSFKAPSNEEAEHDFLWRYHQKVPSRGMIAIFNRSHYEDVLIVRVKRLVPEEVWRPRYQAINQFEQALTLAA
jgi:polyphosphate kinase 2 (PPK2 family)